MRLTALLAVVAGILAPGGVAVASPGPAVRHLYGIARVGSVTRLVPFDVDAAGQITERYDQAVTTEGSVRTFVVSPDARTIYVGAPDHMDFLTFHRIAGAIQVYAVAADGALTLAQSVPAQPTQLVLSPDGSRLFARLATGEVTSFALGANGTVGAQAATTTVGGGGALAIAIEPDGSTLYVSAYPSFIEQYAIGAAGALTTQLPTDLSLAGCQSQYLDVTPDSQTLDVLCDNPSGGFAFSLGAGGGLTQNGSRFSTYGGSSVADVRGRAIYNSIYPHAIEQLQRQADGTLSDFAVPLIFDAATVRTPAADPSGAALAVSMDSNLLKLYAIAPDGSLSAAPTATVATTPTFFDLLAYAPAQAPVAALTSSSTASGAVTFDASASHAADATIARYDWSFGDGTSLADGGAAPSHTYPTGGEYTATVTVSDTLGCSVAGTFGGTMSICAGSPAATARLSVHVPGAPASPTLPVSLAGPLAGAADPGDAARPRAATAAPDASGTTVLLSWAEPLDAPAPTRYLVAWSTLHSAHGPGDTNMHHLRLTTTKTHILMRTRPHTTIHFAVYAYAADGTLTRATKTTLRLPRSA